MIELHGEVSDREAQQMLNVAASALQNTRPLMRTLAHQQYRSTMQNFATQSFDGEAWRPLAMSTQKAVHPAFRGGRAKRKRRRGSRNILHPTGANLKQPTTFTFDEERASVRCATFWAFVHNFGVTVRPRGRAVRIPRRTFLAISRADYANIAKVAYEYIRRAVGG